MKTFYEWSYETVDQDGEIIDIDFSENILELDRSLLGDLALVRDTGNEANGLQSRYYAYVKNNELPEFFSDSLGTPTGIKIPKRFHRELEKIQNN